MQEAAINTNPAIYINFQMFRQLFKLYLSLVFTLRFLITPEDTTAISIKKPQQHSHDIIGGIKAIFWIAMAIIPALLIGQLC